ncbi:valyl-tRNA synthetase [Candidatus Koribacter versatilis Ellin345]|uniref:Valine--tRNA ligase n=1 Tax=Koribacter versatilis (strain Ellin345) TaxID=204669 RepID=Q1IVG3_KORVE|nr:valine--tRNA ligase [Candidatus Koribacter versatilis]ABF39137.1 valyl-tRNA synthetase [Candidatus Koribacter versatilis Ellin345]
MAHELPKAYEPSAIEHRWAEYWVQEKLYHVETPAENDHTPTFTLLLPPPNVTGRLHMGHMLNHTEMDIIIRWRRMRGERTLWLPGTDHAGIATQMMVERQLATEGKNRREIGREKFLERVWEWKKEYGGAITSQMRRIGDSVDWDREYFTMDDHLSVAVREAFVRLYEQGLVYRGKYIVNWCPRCGTAISDLEVAHEETQGKLWEIRYPVEGTDESIVVATTRPETMLGDTAVAVNPKDERYTHLHGKMVRLPLMDRLIPIILDELAQPEFGTGAVKVTPAHDPNDFQAGLRHNLPQIDVMDEHAVMNENAGGYQGLDRYEAREQIVNDLQAQGFLVGIKDHTLALGKCSRCKTIVEPRLSTQWFVAVNKKPNHGGMSWAEAAIAAVEQGHIRFTPENYKPIFLQWMRNIYDWCISRQLWWGHRIPAWYCEECKEVTVARTTPEECSKCGGTKLDQDNDVLDTWFSSGMLPFTTLGWPEKTRDLEVFYPTSLLLTAFDILFFWVARMIMMGCYFMSGPNRPTEIAGGKENELKESIPFKEVYIHSLVRDAERQKMSKTKGNVVDPIDVLNKFGTDAVRFTLASMAAPGTDIAFSESRTESYRSFANKIWNAARFIFMNVDRAAEKGVWSLEEFAKTQPKGEGLPGFSTETLEDRWILSRFNKVAREVSEALETYRFHEASHVVYHFFWGEFCDWYIELTKPRLEADEATARKTFANLLAVFEGALRLLSPFMPFITEEIWHAIYDGKPPLKSISLAEYPKANVAQISDEAETEMAILQDLIQAVRNIRSEIADIKAQPKIKAGIEVFATAEIQQLVERNRGALERLANVSEVKFVGESLAKASLARSTARFEVRVVYEQKVDVAAERERLSKELKKLEGEFANNQRQLGNENFLQKAPAKVVEGLRTREGELKVLIEKAQSALKGLEGK